MPSDIFEMLEENSRKIDRVLLLLDGDKYQAGLIPQVRNNTREIQDLKMSAGTRTVSMSTLVSMAWILVPLVIVFTLADRMVLISDVRAHLSIYGYGAVALSLVLGIMAKSMLVFVMMVFMFRWTGNG